MKIRDILKIINKIINADGWCRVDKGGGSHRQFKHPIKHGRVTISGHPGHDIASGTLNSVLKQAQFKKGGEQDNV